MFHTRECSDGFGITSHTRVKINEKFSMIRCLGRDLIHLRMVIKREMFNMTSLGELPWRVTSILKFTNEALHLKSPYSIGARQVGKRGKQVSN